MQNIPPVIDAHAMLGRETYLSLDARELIRRMDGAGVVAAVARPMGPGLVVDHAAGNDLVLKAGPRIRAMVTANPWWGAKALDELARGRDLGAVGLFVDPARQGFFPTESVAWPLFERATEYGWPVMVRTGTYVYADLLALTEIARRLPETPFIAGFGGFADMWFEVPGVFAATPNLYIEASMIWGEAIRDLAAAHGPSRILFGSAEPRSRYSVSLRTLERLGLDESVMRAILHDNAKRIFGI
ncbi:MAG: amidohydrolase family protein [Planctomycetota bacterium]